MISWGPVDFGERVPGVARQTMAGVAQLDAFQLRQKVTVFVFVPANSGVLLPSSYSPGAEVVILHRDIVGNIGNIWPPPGDQIESFGINVPITISYNETFRLTCFDPPLSGEPRTWWLTGGNGTALPGTSGLVNDGGFLQVTNPTGWPKSIIGLPPGAFWDNGGFVGIVPGYTPIGAPLIFGTITAYSALALSGISCPLSQPNVALQIWNNGGFANVSSYGTGLVNDGGFLQVTITTGWPTSTAGLSPGAFWDNGGFVGVVPGYTPSGPPVYFGSVTSAALLGIGGVSLPVAAPRTGSLQLWNNGGFACVA